MTYPVIDINKRENYTIVIIQGNGEGIYNGAMINGGEYRVKSVGMNNSIETSVLMIDGAFSEKEVVI